MCVCVCVCTVPSPTDTCTFRLFWKSENTYIGNWVIFFSFISLLLQNWTIMTLDRSHDGNLMAWTQSTGTSLWLPWDLFPLLWHDRKYQQSQDGWPPAVVEMVSASTEDVTLKPQGSLAAANSLPPHCPLATPPLLLTQTPHSATCVYYALCSALRAQEQIKHAQAWPSSSFSRRRT